MNRVRPPANRQSTAGAATSSRQYSDLMPVTGFNNGNGGQTRPMKGSIQYLPGNSGDAGSKQNNIYQSTRKPGPTPGARNPAFTAAPQSYRNRFQPRQEPEIPAAFQYNSYNMYDSGSYQDFQSNYGQCGPYQNSASNYGPIPGTAAYPQNMPSRGRGRGAYMPSPARAATAPYPYPGGSQTGYGYQGGGERWSGLYNMESAGMFTDGMNMQQNVRTPVSTPAGKSGKTAVSTSYKPERPAVDKTLHIMTSSVAGIRRWSKYRDQIPMLFEVFGLVDSAIVRGPFDGCKEFLLRDEKDSIECLFFEIDRELPHLTRGQWHRCVGSVDAKTNKFKCVSVRPASLEERRASKAVAAASVLAMKKLTNTLSEV